MLVLCQRLYIYYLTKALYSGKYYLYFIHEETLQHDYFSKSYMSSRNRLILSTEPRAILHAAEKEKLNMVGN